MYNISKVIVLLKCANLLKSGFISPMCDYCLKEVIYLSAGKYILFVTVLCAQHRQKALSEAASSHCF